MQEMLLRAVLGGIVVSSFAILGDVLKPKSFAGLFGAAPSVGLATLALAIHKHGVGYASIEGESMLLGAIAFFCLCIACEPADDPAEVGCVAGDGACSLRMAGRGARYGAVDRTVTVQFNLAALGRSKWYEYAARFAFGGAVTLLDGFVAKRYGPEIGGLFLTFPAIFSATATILENTRNNRSQTRCARGRWQESTRPEPRWEASGSWPSPS